MKRIAVLGGGISGLSLAYFLREGLKNRAEVILLEASKRVGGWIKSVHRAGFIFEQGPRSVRTQASHETLDLVKKLNLESKMVFANKQAHHRFLFFDQKLQRLPTGPKDLLCSSIGRKLLKACLNDLITKKSDHEETVHDFFSRRFSPFIANVLADALVSGVYAGNSQRLSMAACFPSIHRLEQEYGSVIKGALALKRAKRNYSRDGSLFSFVDGMETLVGALEQSLKGALYCGQKVEEIHLNDGALALCCGGETVVADHVFSCLPAHALASIFHTQKPLFSLLSQCKSTSLAVVSFAYAQDVIEKEGFGYLIPRSEKEKNIGVVWDSSVFPHVCDKNKSILTVMIGGEHFGDFERFTESDFISIARESIERQMGLKNEPQLVTVTIAHKAIPQYELGSRNMLLRIKEQCLQFSPHFHLLGSSFYGVAVNDCIKKSHDVAQKFIESHFSSKTF